METLLETVITGIGTAATIIGSLYVLLRNFKSDIRSDIQSLRSEVKSMEMELRHDIRMQSERSDKLYTMFIDLLKEQKDK